MPRNVTLLVLLLAAVALAAAGCGGEGRGGTQYTLTIAVSGDGTVEPASGREFDAGTVVTLTLAPSQHWVSQAWAGPDGGEVTNDSGAWKIVMDGDKNLTAQFAYIAHNLAVNITGEGTVSQVLMSKAAGETNNEADIVTLTAVPQDGCRFDRWEGALTGGTNPQDIAMDVDKTVRAVFARVTGGFDSANADEIVKALVGRVFEGRLAGTDGELRAAGYITDYFASSGLKPGGLNKTYLQNVPLVIPFIDQIPTFAVYSPDGELVKEYRYGVDFREMTYGLSGPGTVISRLGENGGQIKLYRETYYEGPKIYAADRALLIQGIKAAIYPMRPGRDLRFKSVIKDQNEAAGQETLVKILVAPNLLDEIAAYDEQGYDLRLASTLHDERVISHNVIGVLKGTDKRLPPLILAAHYDAVGMDPDGVIFPGALDNASGTAMLIECARILRETKPHRRTVVFVACGAEEESCVGAGYFVKHPPFDLAGAEVLDFDMVGAAADVPISIYGPPGSALADELSALAQAMGMTANVHYLTSGAQFAPFAKAGLAAVSLIHDDSSRMHSPMDDTTNFDPARLEQVAALFCAFMHKRGFGL